MDENWIFGGAEVEATLRELCFPEEVIAALLTGAAKLTQDEDAKERFLAFRREWLEGSRVRLDGPLNEETALWHALAPVSALPLGLESHRERGIPWEITRDTMEDLPRRILNTHRVYGFWGLDVPHWMRHHVLGRIFQIGRLQFICERMYYRVEIYRHGNGTIALAEDNLACRADDWPITPERGEVAWTTSLKREGDSIVGHRIMDSGAIGRDTTRIPASAERLLTADSCVLHIHIPMGRKLDTDACRDSIERALPFFDHYFPETRCEAICCGSWLVDRAFEAFDPRPEKIIAFGKLFTALPMMDTSEATHYQWVFGSGFDYEKAKALPEKTSLQRAMLDYLDRGGILRNTGGYIVRNP